MKKIKVVFVQHQLVRGGAEQALFDLICLMDKEKFDVSVFAQHDGGPWDQKFRDAGIDVVYDYSCRRPTLNPVVKAGNVIKKLRTARCYRNDGENLLDISFPEGVDIVVSFSVWENLRIGFARNARAVKYIHGDIATNVGYQDDARNNAHLMDRFHRIICVSHAACESFKAYTGIRDKVEMHFNPLNSANVHRLAQETVDLPEDVPVICAVGRLAPEKGFERLIVIHKRLVDQGIRHKLVIVGDGPDRDYIRRIVDATDSNDSVILAGFRENPYPYMRHSRFIVCSSFTEGLPVISMEALCLGVPIVAAVPSVGEIFGEECCGIITENDNASLEAGIRKMLTEEDFYARAKAGAQKRSAFFDGKRMVKEIEDLFTGLVNEG